MTLADEFRTALALASLEVDAERFAETVRSGGKIFASSDIFAKLGGTLAGHVVEECRYLSPGTMIAFILPKFFSNVW